MAMNEDVASLLDDIAHLRDYAVARHAVHNLLANSIEDTAHYTFPTTWQRTEQAPFPVEATCNQFAYWLSQNMKDRQGSECRYPDRDGFYVLGTHVLGADDYGGTNNPGIVYIVGIHCVDSQHYGSPNWADPERYSPVEILMKFHLVPYKGTWSEVRASCLSSALEGLFRELLIKIGQRYPESGLLEALGSNNLANDLPTISPISLDGGHARKKEWLSLSKDGRRKTILEGSGNPKKAGRTDGEIADFWGIHRATVSKNRDRLHIDPLVEPGTGPLRRS